MIPFRLRWPLFDMMMSRSRPRFIGPGALAAIKFDRCEFTTKYMWDTHCSRWSAKSNWKHKRREESVSSVVLCLAACVSHGAGGVLLLCDLAKGSVYWQDAGVLPGYQIHQLPMGNLSASVRLHRRQDVSHHTASHQSPTSAQSLVSCMQYFSWRLCCFVR